MTDIRQIVITGISGELGTVLAAELAREDGVQVIGTMRRPRRPTDEFPENVQVLDECDLTESGSCRRLVDLVDAQFGGPFGFIHSVGDFWAHVPFSDFASARAQRMFDSHVMTLYRVLEALVPAMVVRGGGSCVTFSCNSVRYNFPWMAAFTASKSAVDSLVRSLAHEYSGDNIRFNSLMLASLRTGKVLASKPHGDYEHFIEPKAIAPIVRFLMSDAAAMINGNSINIFRHSDRYYHMGYFERIE